MNVRVRTLRFAIAIAAITCLFAIDACSQTSGCPSLKFNLTCGGSFVRASLPVPSPSYWLFVFLSSLRQANPSMLLLLRGASSAFDPSYCGLTFLTLLCRSQVAMMQSAYLRDTDDLAL
jgi:hypothetical protein